MKHEMLLPKEMKLKSSVTKQLNRHILILKFSYSGLSISSIKIPDDTGPQSKRYKSKHIYDQRTQLVGKFNSHRYPHKIKNQASNGWSPKGANDKQIKSLHMLLMLQVKAKKARADILKCSTNRNI